MTSLELSLSPPAIRNVRIDDIQEDFVFLVGEQKFSCPAPIARVVSRQICLQHSIDTSISEYVVQTKDGKDQFASFLSLFSGAAIQVTAANRPFLFSLSRELRNSNVFSSFLKPTLVRRADLCFVGR
jgi:hypothetical protein